MTAAPQDKSVSSVVPVSDLAETEPSYVWRQLSEHIDALAAAWERGEPPELAQFLPSGPPPLRRLALVEGIKVDLEFRWQDRRWPKTIEDYAVQFAELCDERGPPCDIIYEEYHVRRRAGDAVSVEDYCRRFPQRAEELRRLLKIDSHEQTTTLVGANAKAPVFEAGQRIDDFDLLAAVGKGAFATVFLARQCSMQRMVALKISRDRGFEPQTLAQLDHPHIVRVFDQRQLADRKLRLLYMQYVPGGTLQGVIEYVRSVPATLRTGATLLEAIDRALGARGEQPPSDSLSRFRLARASWPQAVCWVGSRLASALDYAHARGVLHRDVKPANVLVSADGHPKLADFNISFSKLDGATPAAYFGGSLAYMSPEQLEACDPAHPRQPDELDGRSDVYSLGVMLWELLTLRRPFADDGLNQSWSNVLAKMTEQRRAGVGADALALVPADCPRAVVDVLLKALAPNPADRWRSAAELARELDLCLQPRAQALLHGGARRSWARRYPTAATILFGVAPNVVMSVVNVGYNWSEIINRLSSDEQRVFLHFQILLINAIAYTIGLGYICTSRGKLFITLVRLARGSPAEPAPSPALVRGCLTLGSATAMVTAALWAISGFVFPTWIHYGAGSTSQLSAGDFAHFVVSNLLCGMISATQSYYVVTFFAVRYCYPWLLRARPAEARDVAELEAVARRGRVALALTFSVPFLALIALVFFQSEQAVMGALGGIGLAGSALAYVLDLAIRGDLAALMATLNPSGDPLGTSDSFEARLAGSR